MVTVKIGERSYELNTREDVSKARAIYAACVGDQSKFESELEENGVEFYVLFDE